MPNRVHPMGGAPLSKLAQAQALGLQPIASNTSPPLNQRPNARQDSIASTLDDDVVNVTMRSKPLSRPSYSHTPSSAHRPTQSSVTTTASDIGNEGNVRSSGSASSATNSEKLSQSQNRSHSRSSSSSTTRSRRPSLDTAVVVVPPKPGISPKVKQDRGDSASSWGSVFRLGSTPSAPTTPALHVTTSMPSRPFNNGWSEEADELVGTEMDRLMPHRTYSGSSKSKSNANKTSTSASATASGPGPRLLFVSSEVKSYTVLYESIKEDCVTTIQYDHATSSLDSMTKLAMNAATHVRDQKFQSIGFIVPGEPGCLHLCDSPQPTSVSSINIGIKRDEAVVNFLTKMAALLSGANARLDFLATLAAKGFEATQLYKALRTLLRRPIVLSTHVTSDPEADFLGDTNVNVVCSQYFHKNKISKWVGPYTQTLAEYEKVCIIGKGAFGSAVLYRKRDDGMYVVLKAINIAELAPKARELALNEHVVLGLLDHPNIIRYYDSFREGDTLQIEMEYADGGTLTNFLSNRNGVDLAETQIRRIFRQLVDALVYIHSKSILHRDLKTQNVFLMMSGEVKLGDFGIAKQLDATRAQAHTLLGTPHYISPELCQGLPYDAKSDMWSLGCILYEMAMLRKPFEGSNLPALVDKIVNSDVDPISQGFSLTLKEAVVSMLDRDPIKRPDAASLFDSKLCAYEESESLTPSRRSVGSDTHSSVFYWGVGVSVPTRFAFDTKIRVGQVAVGLAHGTAVSTEGLVFTWGENTHGQLGHGDTLARNEPQVVVALLNKPTVKVACGGDVTLMISNTGLLQACGRGEFGCLGNGELVDRHLPHLVHKFVQSEVVDVALGTFHASAITNNGDNEIQLWTWGRSKKGRLGLGMDLQSIYTTPQPVELEDQCIPMAVQCGLDGTMLLSESNFMYATGNNKNNKLGLNSRSTIRSYRKGKEFETAWQFTRVVSIGKCEVSTMSAGNEFGATVTTAGSCFMFGSNAVGGLGSGDTKQLRGSYAVTSGLADYHVLDVTCGETFTVVSAQVKRTCSIKSSDDLPDFKPTKVFAWGRGMADRCEKLPGDDRTTIYVPAELGLTEPGATDEVLGIDAHHNTLVVAIQCIIDVDQQQQHHRQSSSQQQHNGKILNRVVSSVNVEKSLLRSPNKNNNININNNINNINSNNGVSLGMSGRRGAEYSTIVEPTLDETPAWLQIELDEAANDDVNNVSNHYYDNHARNNKDNNDNQTLLETARERSPSPTFRRDSTYASGGDTQTFVIESRDISPPPPLSTTTTPTTTKITMTTPPSTVTATIPTTPPTTTPPTATTTKTAPPPTRPASLPMSPLISITTDSPQTQHGVPTHDTHDTRAHPTNTHDTHATNTHATHANATHPTNANATHPQDTNATHPTNDTHTQYTHATHTTHATHNGAHLLDEFQDVVARSASTPGTQISPVRPSTAPHNSKHIHRAASWHINDQLRPLRPQMRKVPSLGFAVTVEVDALKELGFVEEPPSSATSSKRSLKSQPWRRHTTPKNARMNPEATPRTTASTKNNRLSPPDMTSGGGVRTRENDSSHIISPNLNKLIASANDTNTNNDPSDNDNTNNTTNDNNDNNDLDEDGGDLLERIKQLETKLAQATDQIEMKEQTITRMLKLIHKKETRFRLFPFRKRNLAQGGGNKSATSATCTLL